MTSNFPQWQVNLFSWGLAGAFITAGYPLDFVRSRMQVMPELIERGLLHKNYTGMLDCLRRVHLEEGLKAFWKGNGSNLVRLLPNESCVFYLKELLQRTFQLDPQMKASAFVLLNSAIGITAGWIVAIAFYPIEFTRQQLTNRVERTGLGMHHHFKETIRSNGVRGLYKGVHLFLMGSVVFRGTYFGIYDSVKINA
jgi:solute carrier family 25 (adenine nucleotide translocator) protein 4/5/6/31